MAKYTAGEAGSYAMGANGWDIIAPGGSGTYSEGYVGIMPVGGSATITTTSDLPTNACDMTSQLVGEGVSIPGSYTQVDNDAGSAGSVLAWRA